MIEVLPNYSNEPINQESPQLQSLNFQKVLLEEELKTKVKEAGRAAWKKLFTEVKISDQLVQWEKEIPKYGCDCSNFYQEWKSANPPEENIGFTWKWRLKNAVNEKLNQPQLSLEDAKAFWANFGVNTDG